MKNMITSTSNKRMKEISNLQKKSSARNKEGVYIVEGIKMFEECPKEEILEAIVSESFYNAHQKMVDGKCGHRCTFVTDAVFSSISDTKTPQGIMLIVKQPKMTMKTMLTNLRPTLLILENIQDPGNLGTILRAAEGGGISGIIISDTSVDLFHPKVIRATMGSIFRLQVFISSDLEESIAKLRSIGIKILVTDLSDSMDYDLADYTKSCAIVIGNESKGVSDRVKDLANEKIRIPMLGQVESLNAGVATSVIVYEMARQRRRYERD